MLSCSISEPLLSPMLTDRLLYQDMEAFEVALAGSKADVHPTALQQTLVCFRRAAEVAVFNVEART